MSSIQKEGMYLENGITYYYHNDKLHREDGPAKISHGVKEWYLNGVRHRVDGPAKIFYNGDKEWYLNGVRHRVDGPARDWSDGSKSWWLGGTMVYSKKKNNIHLFKNLSEPFKQSIIKYQLINS
jgi:hypothetical protein